MRGLITLIFLVSLFPAASKAEFICRATVSYSWEKDKEMSKIIVFVNSVETKGVDEKAAKSLLSERVEKEKVKASEQCARDHENQAGCVASKFNALSSTIQALPFSSRKLLEDSIAADCKAQQGKCLESVAGEPQCSEIISAAAAAEGKEGGKEGGKESKKKK